MNKEFFVKSIKDMDYSVTWSNITIGDEGCIYSVLNKGIKEIVLRAYDSGITVRFLTPFIPDKHMEEVYKIIEDISQKFTLKVTFNDYGLLFRCKSLIEMGKIIPVAGRILIRSVIDCPWYDDLLKHEHPELKKAITGYSLIHSSKWKVLRQFGISEIELNLVKSDSIQILKENGFHITGYARGNLISVGRFCYSARWENININQCVQKLECNNKIYIQLDKKWGKMKLMYEIANEESKELYKDIYVVGNKVYKELDAEQVALAETNFDSLIYEKMWS